VSARHIADIISDMFDRHGLPARVEDRKTGRSLTWDPALRGYDAGQDEVVPAFFVRSQFRRRFFEVSGSLRPARVQQMELVEAGS